MRNVRRAAPAEASALMKFTFHAAAPNGIRVIIRPSIVYTGFPGGCGRPRMEDVAMNSPESQNGTVGGGVRREKKRGIKNESAAASWCQRFEGTRAPTCAARDALRAPAAVPGG